MESYRPRRIRLMQPDFQHYSGPIGLVNFENGVSTEAVSWIEAGRIGAIMSIEDANEPGFQISPAAEMTRHLDRTSDDKMVKALHAGTHVNAEGAAVMERYTREELEDIADKQGLSGVRELARRWGRTGRSILECINETLDAQRRANVSADESVTA